MKKATQDKISKFLFDSLTRQQRKDLRAVMERKDISIGNHYGNGHIIKLHDGYACWMEIGIVLGTAGETYKALSKQVKKQRSRFNNYVDN